MDIKIGAIIIGSLLWEDTEKRKKWRNELLLNERISVEMPIRYGRQSLENRKGTYSMVFSNQINKPKTMGRAFVVPFKSNITSSESFVSQMGHLSDAEGISDSRICKSWGTVSLIVNPFIEQYKKTEILDLWNKLVNSTTRQLTRNQRLPDIEKFGSADETKSIDDQWILTIDLNSQFKNELKKFDVLIATSNAVKLKDNLNIYPTISQIAKAINDSKYFEYFLRNRINSIRTFQDKKIARILKRKYKISLKNEIKKLSPLVTAHSNTV